MVPVAHRYWMLGEPRDRERGAVCVDSVRGQRLCRRCVLLVCLCTTHPPILYSHHLFRSGAAQMPHIDTEAFSSVSDYHAEHTVGDLLEAMGTAVRVHVCVRCMVCMTKGWRNVRTS